MTEMPLRNRTAQTALPLLHTWLALAATFIATALPAPVQAQAADCAAASAPNLVMALRTRNAPRALALVQCRRDLALDGSVRSAVSGLFRRADWAERAQFLEEVRQGGFDFLADFQPEFPSEWGSYGDSPLRQAVLGGNTDAMRWLARGTDAKAMASYPALLPAWLKSNLPRETDALEQSGQAVGALVTAGLPVSFNDNEPYRLALSRAMAAAWVTQRNAVGAGHVSRNWERLFSAPPAAGDAAFWQAMAQRLAPRDPAARTKADARVNVEFVQPRMAMIGEMESGLRQMLAGGARDGLVVDPYQELGATGWAAADGVKARLMALQALRERLLKLEPKPGG